MDSMDYFSLPRKQLQALCKKNGIPANSTNLVMAEALTALIKNLNGDEGEQHSNEKEACKQEGASIITDANCVIISDDDEVSSPVAKTKNQRSKPKKSQPQSDGGEAAETGEETVDDDGGSEEENKAKSGRIPARKAVVDHATPAAKKTPHTRARKTRGAALTEDVVNNESDEAADKAPKGRSRKKVSYENADPSSMDEDNDNGVKRTRSRAAKTPAATRASSRTAAKTTTTRVSSRTAAAKAPAPMPSAIATEPPAEDVPHKTPCTRGRRRATIKEVIATDEDDAVKKPDGKTRRRNVAVREPKGCMEASTQGEVQQEKVANRRQTRRGKSRICYDSDELQSQKEDEGMQSEHDEKNEKQCEIREIATEKEKESECNEEETQEGFIKEVQEQVVLCTEEESKTSVESIEQCQIENLDTDLCEEVVLELHNKRESTVEMQDLADFEAPAKEVEVCTENQNSADFEAEIPHDKEVEKQTVADIEAGASPVEEYHTEIDTENKTIADFEVEVSHDEVEVCTKNQTSADFEAEIPHDKEVEKQTVADIEAEASPVEELRTERDTENKTIADFEVEVSHDEVECNTGVLSENMILESYNDEEEQNEDTEEAKDELKYASDQKESRRDEVKSEFMSNENEVFSENIADANLPTESDSEEVEQNEDSEEVEDELKCTNDQNEASQEVLEQQNEVFSEYIADANLPTESDNDEDKDSEEVGEELKCTNDQNEASQEVLEQQEDGNSELISKEEEEIEEEYPCDPKEVSKENEMVRSEDEAKTEEDELSVKADADIQDLEELNAELDSEIFDSQSHQEIKSEIHKNVHEQITEDEDEEEESDKMDEASFEPESMDGENQEMNVKKNDCPTEEFKAEGSNDENEEANVGPSEYLTDYSSQIQLRKEESSYCIEVIKKEKEEYQTEECSQIDRAETCLVEQNSLSKVTAANSDIVEAVVSQKQHRKPLTDLNNRRSSSGFKTLKSFSLRRLRKEVQKLEAQKKEQKMKKAENHHDAENIENSDSQISCLQKRAPVDTRKQV